MRKKLIVLLCVLCMAFCTCAVLPVMASTTPAAEPVVQSTYLKLNMVGAKGKHTAFGPDRKIVLQDGESVSMKFTVASASIANNPDGNTGFMLGKQADLFNQDPANTNVSVLSNGNANEFSAFVDGASTKESTGFARSKVFDIDNEILVTYKPYQSEKELGSFALKVKKVNGGQDFSEVVGVNDLTKDQAGRDLVPYLISYDKTDLVIKDFSVTTSKGADLVSSAVKAVEKKNNGTCVTGTGFGYAYADAKIDYVLTSEATQSMEFAADCYVGPDKPASVKDGEKLVLEFDINDVTYSGCYGFYIGWRADLNGALWSQAGVGGIMIFTQGDGMGNDIQIAGNGKLKSPFADGDSYIVDYIWKQGNSVKVVYDPIKEAKPESYTGTLDVYITNKSNPDGKRALHAEIGYKGAADGSGTSARLDTANDNLYLRLLSINKPGKTLDCKNFHEYVLDKDGNKNIVFDARYGGATFANSIGKIAPKRFENNYTDYEKIDKTENKISFNDVNGNADYDAYVKTGSSYVLPRNVVGEQGTLVKWQKADGTLLNPGQTVTVDADMALTPVVADIVKIQGASIRTNDPSGLRFETHIDFNKYNKLSEVASSVKAGTLIVPTDMISGVEFTKKALSEKNITFIDIENNGWYNNATAEADGYYKFYGSIVNILGHNLARQFSSVSYLEYVVDGVTYFEYSDTVSRSVYDVAKGFVADEKNEVADKENVSAKYIDTVIEIKGNEIVAVTGYASPYSISVEGKTITVSTTAENMALKTAKVDGKIYKVAVSGTTATITLGN